MSTFDLLIQYLDEHFYNSLVNDDDDAELIKKTFREGTSLDVRYLVFTTCINNDWLHSDYCMNYDEILTCTRRANILLD